MKCIIVDDEKLAQEVLRILISKSSDIELLEVFENAIEAIKYLNDNNMVDLIFLDIHMHNFSGIDLIKTLKNPPQIILVTVDKNFAIDAFNYDCVTDYLLKPIQQSRFKSAIERANQKSKIVLLPKNNNEESADIYINIDKRLIRIEKASINFIKADRDYLIINTETNEFRVHTCLKKIEEKLDCSFLIKTHRSYIVNIKKIIDIENNTILIKNKVIPISRDKRIELMSRLNLI